MADGGWVAIVATESFGSKRPGTLLLFFLSPIAYSLSNFSLRQILRLRISHPRGSG
jgi:hypothetical protein